MKVEMLRDFKVAADGVTVETWKAGAIHEATDQLGGDLIGAGVAKAVSDDPPSPQPPVPRPAKGRK